jgi:hypothetical protein
VKILTIEKKKAEIMQHDDRVKRMRESELKKKQEEEDA